jgi:hypothetical protein
MEIREIIEVVIGYVVPLIAIVLSIFSFHDSRKINKVQLRLNEMEEKLKKYELEEIEKVREAANRSIVEARICNVSKGKYRLKIWSSGQATAYDVDFEVPEELKNLVYKDKVPFEVLEAGKSFEEYITFYYGAPPKFTVKTTWRNASGEKYEKEQWVTF